MILRETTTRLHTRLVHPQLPDDVAVLCFDDTETASDETCALGHWARLARRHLRLVRLAVGADLIEMSLS